MQAAPLALELAVHARHFGLGEDHFAQQAGDEVTAAAGRVGRQHLPFQPIGGCHGAHHAVDRMAFLRAAGEVDAAQQGRRFVAGRLEHVRQEGVEHVAQAGELLREAVQQGAPLDVALALHALQQARLQLPFQRLELGREGVQRRHHLLRFHQRETHAPHLAPFVLAHFAEEFGEAGQQVALGDHDVDREAHAQLFMQVLDAGADGQRLLLAVRLALLQQVGHADGQDHAVDGPPPPMLAQQLQKAAPGRLVHFLVAVLGGVAAGRVEQHRFVREPPVAVTGAAHAAQRVLAQRFGQREVQAGLHQGRGLARPRCADKHIPRQLVQVLAAAPPAALAQDLHRLLQALGQQRHLGLGLLRLRAGRLLRTGHSGGQPGVGHARGDPFVEEVAGPDQQQQCDPEPAHPARGEWLLAVKGQQRPFEPDHQRQQQDADQRQRRGPQQPGKDTLHRVGYFLFSVAGIVRPRAAPAA